MTTRKFAILCSVSALALTTACTTYSPRYESMGSPPSTVGHVTQSGRVLSIEVVQVASRTSGGGAVVGAVIGGVIGNRFGGGTGRAAATGLGVVGGAVIGNEVERRNQNDSDIYRIRVRFDNGSIGQFDYQNIGDLRVGDRVKAEGGLLQRF